MNTCAAGFHGIIRVIVIVLLLVAVAGCSVSSASGELLTHDLAEPLNGATSAKIDINCGPGHLTIDRLTGGEPLLAGGTLQYLEKQGPPTWTLSSGSGQATLTLQAQAGRQAGFRWPWQACAGSAFEWQLHLNPNVPYDIAAHSDGGNVKLDLAGLAITRLAADTAGGNMDVFLPGNAADLSVTAKTGAGNATVEIGSGTTGSSTVSASSGAGKVIVRVPGGIAARIHATSRLGKVLVDSRFSKLDGNTYQSPGYDGAADRVEITVSSGAGNVSIDTIQDRQEGEA